MNIYLYLKLLHLSSLMCFMRIKDYLHKLSISMCWHWITNHWVRVCYFSGSYQRTSAYNYKHSSVCFCCVLSCGQSSMPCLRHLRLASCLCPVLFFATSSFLNLCHFIFLLNKILIHMWCAVLFIIIRIRYLNSFDRKISDIR